MSDPWTLVDRTSEREPTAEKSACPCGERLCHRHNRAFWYRLSKNGKPGRRPIRVDVFRWDERQGRTAGRVWTWCPVVNGEPVDHHSGLGHYDSWKLAFADAFAWVSGRLGEPSKAVDTQ
jgi:hypothetical protein